MSVKCTSSAYALPILRPRLVYLTSSGTPGDELSMAPQVPGAVSTDGVATKVNGVYHNLATYVSTKPHGLAEKDKITVSGAAETKFNGTFGVFSVVDEVTFTYYIPVVGAPAVEASVSCTYICLFQSALVISDATNDTTNHINFGPNSAADMDVVPAGSSYSVLAPHGSKLDLADYYFKSASASQLVRVQVI